MRSYIDSAEPRPSLMAGPGLPGRMSGKEAYQRVVTSLEFLIWEFELRQRALAQRDR